MGKIRHSKLLLIWQSLSKEEIRALKRFLQSPFFTLRQDVFRLYEQLKKLSYWPSNEESLHLKSFSRLSLFKYTFPTQSFDDQRLRSCMNDLQDLLERFLLLRDLEQNPVGKQLALTRIYQQRQLDKHFSFARKKLQTQFEQDPWRNADHHHNVLAAQIQSLLHESRKRRTGELHLQQVSDSIDRVYLIRKLRYACTQLSHQAVNSTNYDFGLLPSLIAQIPTSSYYETPAVAIYYHCYKFLSEAYSDDHYQLFSQLFFQEAIRFPPFERKGLYLLALNFCIRRHNNGELVFTREAWRLYRFALDQGLLIEDQHLSRFTFNNITGIAIKLNELDWAYQFIKDFEPYIHEEFRSSSLSLNLARLAFSKGEYEATLPYLQAVNRKDLLNNLIARSLLIKVFYETKAFTALNAQLDSLEQLLRRKDVSAFHRRNYGAFIRLLRRNLDLAPYDKEERLALKETILNSRELSEKDWLLHILV